MSDARADLQDQLDHVAARLARIERRLGILTPPPLLARTRATTIPPSDESPATSIPATLAAAPPAAPAADERSPGDPTAAPTLPEIDLSELVPAAESVELAAAATIDLSHPELAVPSENHGSDAPAPAMARAERMIGERWLAALGAVAVTVGVVLLFRLALQRGWIVLTPATRCIAGAAFGMLLLGAGEWARRRISALASAGLSAAGIGVAYASAYAAYGLYHLLDAPAAFAILAAVAFLGIFIAARASLVSVAAISLVGGYLTPILLADSPPAPIVLPAYLLALLAVGLVLSAWRGGKFVILRAFVWWATLVYGAVWTLTEGPDSPLITVCFLALVWCAVHAELTIAAARFGLGSADSRPGRKRRASRRDISDPLTLDDIRAWRPLSSSFSTTAWAGMLGVFAIRAWGLPPDWLAPAALALGASWLALILAGHLRVLQDVPRTDSQRLGACLAVQAGALIIAAVALAFSGAWEVLAWVAMGAAIVVAGRWIRSRALDVYGLVLLSIGTARLIIYDTWAGGLTSNGFRLFDSVVLTQWSGLMAGASVAWFAAAALLRLGTAPGTRWRILSNICVGTGLTVLLSSVLHPDNRPEATAAVLITLCIADAAAARRLESLLLSIWSGAAAAIFTLWFLLWHWWTGDGPAIRLVGLHLTAWTPALIYAAAAWFTGAALLRPVARAGTAAPQLSNLFAGLGIACLAASLLHAANHHAASAGVFITASLALCTASRFLRSIGLLGTAFAAAAIAIAWIVVHRWWVPSPRVPAVEWLGLHLTIWTPVLIYAAAAWLAASRRLASLESPAERGLSSVPAAVAASLLLASLLHRDVSAASLSIAWALLASLIALSRRLEPRLHLDRIGLHALAAAAITWCVAYPPFPHGWKPAESPVALHPAFWIGLLLAALAWLSGRFLLVLARPQDKPWRTAACSGAVLLLFCTTSLEVGRSAEVLTHDATARMAAVSVWWGIFASCMIVAGFAARRTLGRSAPIVRHIGLGLLGAAALKAVVVDLASVDPLARVVSFIGLGLLMLGIAVVYARVSAHLAAPRPAPAA